MFNKLKNILLAGAVGLVVFVASFFTIKINITDKTVTTSTNHSTSSSSSSTSVTDVSQTDGSAVTGS